MIKVGFICEGYTERILLESTSFRQLLTSFNIEPLRVINAEGCENLLPHNIQPYTLILENLGAQHIIIVTDLDDDSCVTETKNRISARKQDIVIVAVKKIEAWFLACNVSMSHLIQKPQFKFNKPEEEKEPFDTINQLLIVNTGRGVGRRSGKIKLAYRMLEVGFDVINAAAHPNCPSAAYFLRKLKEIGASGT
ncbi:MAG TPA: hypothetical protein VGS79_13125 [Puia sp.]|nr:hypothetical protein [Puia sp.]